MSRLHDQTQTHSLCRATLDERSNTQHPQKRDIHLHGRIRTRNPSQRAAADLCLRTRGRWDRSTLYNTGFNVDTVSGFRVSRDAVYFQSFYTYLRGLAPLVVIVTNKKVKEKFLKTDLLLKVISGARRKSHWCCTRFLDSRVHHVVITYCGKLERNAAILTSTVFVRSGRLGQKFKSVEIRSGTHRTAIL